MTRTFDHLDRLAHPDARRWRGAIHEASHCVVSCAIGRGVESVEVFPDGGGRCHGVRYYAESRERFNMRNAAEAVAGEIGEGLFAEGIPVAWRFQSCRKDGQDLLAASRKCFPGDPGRQEDLRHAARALVADLLREHREAVLAVATELQAKGKLSKPDIFRLCRHLIYREQ